MGKGINFWLAFDSINLGIRRHISIKDSSLLINLNCFYFSRQSGLLGPDSNAGGGHGTRESQCRISHSLQGVCHPVAPATAATAAAAAAEHYLECSAIDYHTE